MLAYLKRNAGELVNLIEAFLRLAGSIASFTPTDKDDSIVATVKVWFGKAKGFLERIGG